MADDHFATRSTVGRLVLYDAACRALAEAVAVDEVKSIRDKAVAMQTYAAQAKDIKLIEYATDIRMRAERRAGELLREMAERKERHTGKAPKGSRVATPTAQPKLADLGVSKTQSSRWQKIAGLSEPDFNSKISKAVRGAVAAVEGDKAMIREVRAEALQRKRERRAEREQQLGAKHCALPDRKFGVIVADPEWNDEVWSRETGMDRHASNHYPTSDVSVIASRPVASIATKDCVLFLWTTNQHLRIAHGVLEAWGFEYKSNYVWGKDKASTGRWNRSRHEILLIGTRGDVPCPAPGEQWDSLIMAPRGAHSAKPKCFLEMIEQYFPNVPKIELNCRGAPRPGWEAWGNEVEADASAHRVLNAKSVGTLTPDQVYVGRVFRPRFPLGSKWGNKFEIPRDGTRAEVIEKYRAWIGTQPALMAALEELRGKDLVCWCAPLPCHADVLLELANREAPGPDPVAAADLAASAGRSTP